jgi:hypothetical protein
MAFIPAMFVGGHLLIAVVDKIPEVNFNQTCREASGEALGMHDDFDDCVKDETRARDELARQWSEFNTADRARCTRMATTDHPSSYVELLACLEMEQRAKSLRTRPSRAVIMELPQPSPVRAQEKPPLQSGSGRAARQLVQPLTAARPPAPTGLLAALCQSALRAILLVCW